MVSGGQLLGFTLASLVLIVIPGPGVLFIVGRALAHGRRTALATACGHAAGNYVVAAGSRGEQAPATGGVPGGV
jgi:threonine/homoserine/homoserine lactone efflux protein